jgi:ATP-dependent helicase/nuclease subunit A
MDSFERQKALNPEQSFIVQAPAGSGKTELLTQRYLALLAKVEDPQGILALTFTKKAAQEMRHRILEALQDAASDRPIKGEHQNQTRKLAKQALIQNENHQWGILTKPQQLRITTFDAFCLELYQALPQPDETRIPNISNYPDLCYHKATQQWFNWCREQENLQDALKHLLQQMDYKPNKLFIQLQGLLKTRDQWLSALGIQSQGSKADHQALFAHIISEYYASWSQHLPTKIQDNLIELCQKMANIRPDRYPNLGKWQHFADISHLQVQELASLLLNSQDEFRSLWNHHVGLQTQFCPKPELKELQAQSQELLQELGNFPEFKALLIRLPQLPDPKNPSINWKLLQAYYRLLPLLIAHLHLEFSQQGHCDFIYIAQQALFALQESDLSLQMDQQLQHLLVDEFQDTSELQQQLLEQLTLDWEQSLEKTIFLVGDPMQSIYRFRAAKVSIFLQVQQQGLGLIKMQKLQLKQNFRSAPELVENLNQLCQNIFPQQENIDLGAVGFHPAHPGLSTQIGAQISAEFFQNTAEQTQKIIDILNLAETEKPKTMAILVRNRRQIAPIIQALEAHDKPYQGLDLKPIRQQWVVRDMWTITKLLLNPGHRSNELACFRSPFIGLNIEDLHQLANIETKKSLIPIIKDPLNLQNLSLENQTRLMHFSKIFEKANQCLQQIPFQEALYQMFLDLQIHLIYPSTADQAMMETFFQILEQFSQYHAWPNWMMIEDYLNHFFISNHQGMNLQIMTMHKSKGLEFDWVIIPNMGDGQRPIQTKALMWVKTQKDTLFFPHDPHQSPNSQFYRLREQEQESFETQRLAYVAFTRAKNRLYLLDDKIKPEKASFRSLFPENFFQVAQVYLTENNKLEKDHQAFCIKRIPIDIYQKTDITPKKPSYKPGSNFTNAYTGKQFGVITHKMLQWICQHHPETFEQIPWQLAKNHLKRYQLPSSLLTQIKDCLKGFWHCPIGTWIREVHEFEANELPLLIKDQEITRQLILDRSFIHASKRWIIDFKTGHQDPILHPKYQEQLNRYAHHMQELSSDYPVHCGLYYLGSFTWDSWTFAATKSPLA